MLLTFTLRKLLVSAALILGLTSCAGSYHSYIDTLRLAFTTQPDASLTMAEVANSPFDFLYVTHGDRPQSITALMFIEQGQLKWISADEAMLITDKGRIVRTLGLNNDLQKLTAVTADPIANWRTINANTRWQRSVDWAADEYGYSVNSYFEVQTGHSLSFFQQQFAVTKVVEHLTYGPEKNYLRFDQDWQNVFWFDANSGALLQSEQQLAPFTEPMRLIFISQIVRELAQQTKELEAAVL